MHTHILLINPLIPHREILHNAFCNIFFCSISIHSSHIGRYFSKLIHFEFFIYFNPLIPYRELQQYCTKICYHILTVLPKIICFLHLPPQKFSNFQELTAKMIPIPVRIPYSFHVSFRFAPEWQLLSIATYHAHITSLLSLTIRLLYKKRF